MFIKVYYVIFDDVMNIIVLLGKGCLIVKIDIELVFCIVFVCRKDFELLEF